MVDGSRRSISGTQHPSRGVKPSTRSFCNRTQEPWWGARAGREGSAAEEGDCFEARADVSISRSQRLLVGVAQMNNRVHRVLAVTAICWRPLPARASGTDQQCPSWRRYLPRRESSARSERSRRAAVSSGSDTACRWPSRRACRSTTTLTARVGSAVGVRMTTRTPRMNWSAVALASGWNLHQSFSCWLDSRTVKSSGCGLLRLTAMWMPVVRRWSGSPMSSPTTALHGWPRSPIRRERRTGADRITQSAMSAIAFHQAQSADRVFAAMARDDASRRVRGRALFWLATRASREALSAITGAIENDPDTDVKKKAGLRAQPDAERRRRPAAD